MSVKLRYRGREVTDSDVAFIVDLIARHPGASRRALSKLLCEAWKWRQDNGELRDMVCRVLMLELHRAGLIELPPVRQLANDLGINLNTVARAYRVLQNSALVHAAVDGEKLDDLAFNMFFILLILAGNETTRNALSGGMLALAEHP